MTIPAAYAWIDALDPQPKIINEAMKLFGIHEGQGAVNNPVILEWAKEVGVQQVYTADSIPWCGLFAAVVVKRAGKVAPAGPLWALNWKNFGRPGEKPLDPGQPGLGDVLVFVRPGGGHVGFYIGEDALAYHVLGGNTSDSVSIARIEKHRLYACRRWRYDNQPATVKPYILAAAGTISHNEA